MKVLRGTVEQMAEFAPMEQILDDPVPHTLEQLADILERSIKMPHSQY